MASNQHVLCMYVYQLLLLRELELIGLHLTYPFQEEVLTCQSPSFVQTHQSSLPCKWDPKWLSAENFKFSELLQSSIDSHCQLHRELWRDYRSEYEDAPQH